MSQLGRCFSAHLCLSNDGGLSAAQRDLWCCQEMQQCHHTKWREEMGSPLYLLPLSWVNPTVNSNLYSVLNWKLILSSSLICFLLSCYINFCSYIINTCAKECVFCEMWYIKLLQLSRQYRKKYFIAVSQVRDLFEIVSYWFNISLPKHILHLIR